MDNITTIPRENPFADPGSDGAVDPLGSDTSLTVARNVSLTLATDSLIVFDEAFTKRSQRRCCGLLPSKSKSTRAIPFFNILWARLSEFDIVINYAQLTSKETVRAAIVTYPVDKDDRARAAAWVERLLDRAYGASQKNKRVKVLINSFSGKGSAQKWYLRDIEPILAAARCKIDVERTQYQGHAVEIAQNIDVDAYDVVACCSGDGVPHEVFNGLGKRPDARRALKNVAVVQLPCGSGNAMSHNLNGTGSPSLAALTLVKGLTTPLDLVSITQGDRRTLSFLSQSVGIVAESDLGTENLRWMGAARFTYGFLVRLLGKTIYPCDIAVKVEIADKPSIKEHYRRELGNHAPASERRGPFVTEADAGLPPLQFGSCTDELPADWPLVPHDNLGNFYCGNMAFMAADANFFPASLPNDGCLDLVCIAGDISRITALQSLMAIEQRTFFDMAHVSYRKVLGYRIIPKARREGVISIDGERVPYEPFQAEVHRGLGTVLSKTGHKYEAWGVVSA
ncbi:MAG: hypothetical protein M4579_005886 [Chaenotheca gracillima]|nr:MAG: hypothetical protein M4579_005886 [Chaenotheca gracillima]